MKITDQGIIISAKKYSETSLIVKILSAENGLYSGFVKGALTKKNAANFHNFNLVDFEWSSRIAENLGFFKVEVRKSFLAAIISSQTKLYCLNIAAEIIARNAPERDPQFTLFDKLLALLNNLDQAEENFIQKYIRFEIDLLDILGFGLDLTNCAATGSTENLHFVSPKSARAVCQKAAMPFLDKMLPLPQLLLQKENEEVERVELIKGLKLTGYFINKHLAAPDLKNNHNNIANWRNFLTQK